MGEQATIPLDLLQLLSGQALQETIAVGSSMIFDNFELRNTSDMVINRLNQSTLFSDIYAHRYRSCYQVSSRDGGAIAGKLKLRRVELAGPPSSITNGHQSLDPIRPRNSPLDRWMAQSDA